MIYLCLGAHIVMLNACPEFLLLTLHQLVLWNLKCVLIAAPVWFPKLLDLHIFILDISKVSCCLTLSCSYSIAQTDVLETTTLAPTYTRRSSQPPHQTPSCKRLGLTI